MESTTILVVEDESGTALALQTTLEQMGYRIPATTASGEGALVLVEELAPDLVIMDINLDGKMNGIEAADKIRAAQWTALVPGRICVHDVHSGRRKTWNEPARCN